MQVPLQIAEKTEHPRVLHIVATLPVPPSVPAGTANPWASNCRPPPTTVVIGARSSSNAAFSAGTAFAGDAHSHSSEDLYLAIVVTVGGWRRPWLRCSAPAAPLFPGPSGLGRGVGGDSSVLYCQGQS
jgi:hypothetical protein